MELLQLLVRPFYRDLPGPGAVALLDQHCDKLRLVQLRLDYDLLALLNIDAGAGDQLGIAAQYRFFHSDFLSARSFGAAF